MNISKQSRERIDWLKAMPAAAKFEAIAMKIKNPAIFSQFIALDEDASVWDYAYAAGLISKADADFAKAREAAESEGGEGEGEGNKPPLPDPIPGTSPGQKV